MLSFKRAVYSPEFLLQARSLLNEPQGLAICNSPANANVLVPQSQLLLPNFKPTPPQKTAVTVDPTERSEERPRKASFN